MSRKSDLALAGEYYVNSPLCGAFEKALEITYDLGRAQGIQDAIVADRDIEKVMQMGERLRAKVRRAAGETK